MKKYVYCVAFVFYVLFPLLNATPKFNISKKYRIACYQDNFNGAALVGSLHEQTSPLIYDPTMTDYSNDAYWIFTEVGNDTYSIRNASTGKYVQFDGIYGNETGKRYIDFVDKQEDNTTLWTFLRKEMDNRDCYAIVSVSNPTYVFNRRGSGVGVLGGYVSGGASSNEIYAFCDESGSWVEDDGAITETDPEVVIDGTLANYFADFTLNGKGLVYSKNETDTYYYSFPIEVMGTNTDVTRTLEYAAKNSQYKVYINNTLVANGAEYVFEKLSADKIYTIQIRDNTSTLASIRLIVTGLPIVQVFVGSCNGSSYTLGHIKVHEPNNNLPAEYLNAGYKWRGASTEGRPKKSYNVKLKDAVGEKLHKSFFGLREDNNWILDAMTVDPLRMRNRVCMDLWNAFSADPYYSDKENNIRSGTRGQYVELFYNNVYAGMYCMSEKIDRKQLKLKKYDDLTGKIYGVLYKSENWTYSNFMGHYGDSNEYPKNPPPGYDNHSEYWDGYEVKCPDYGDGQTVDWKPLWDAVNFVATSDDEDFSTHVSEHFDIPVWTDYFLFIDLLLATDNHGKNLFIYNYDINESEMMGIAPWDVDGVFGIRWESSKNVTYAAQDFTTFIRNYEHGEYTIFKRLKELNPNNYNENIRYRYKELRDTYFSVDSLQHRFAVYKDLFDRSGAGARETAKWGGNLNDEMNYINSWIEQRTAFLDGETQYNIEDLEILDPVISYSLPKSAITYGRTPSKFTVTSTNTSVPIKCELTTEGVVSIDNNILTILKAGKTSVRITQAANQYYTAVDLLVPIEVKPRNIMAMATMQEREYGQDNPEWVVNYSDLVYDDELKDVIITPPTISCAATKTSPVGNYIIDLTGGVVSSNYKLSTITGSLSVTKVPLLIIADDKQREEATANPEFTCSYEGFVNGENEHTALTQLPQIICLANAQSPVGTYPIAVSGATAQNYEITYQTGTLEVTVKTDVAEESVSRPEIYPNPVVRILNVTNVEVGTLLLVADAEGRVVYNQKADAAQVEIDMSSFAPGFYYLKVGETKYTLIKK